MMSSWVRMLFAVVLFLGELFAQSSPLIMEHADSLAVSEGGNKLLLFGKVRFRHDSLVFFTQRAEWNRRSETIHCTGGFRFVHPAGNMRADEGDYAKIRELATARGNVLVRDSSGLSTLSCNSLRYDRKNHHLELRDQPVLQSLPDSTKNQSDTLTLVARYMEYNDSTKVAHGYGDVRLTSGELEVNCDTAVYDRKAGLLSLSGNPRTDLREYHLEGEVMEIALDGQKVREIRVIRKALGTLGKGEILTEVEGDSLSVFFERDTIRSLAVRNNSKGRFWQDGHSEYVNRMRGVDLDLSFSDGRPLQAKISKDARTYYYHISEKGILEGENEAVGDTIFVDFRENRVESLIIRGSLAEGAFFGNTKHESK